MRPLPSPTPTAIVVPDLRPAFNHAFLFAGRWLFVHYWWVIPILLLAAYINARVDRATRRRRR